MVSNNQAFKTATSYKVKYKERFTEYLKTKGIDYLNKYDLDKSSYYLIVEFSLLDNKKEKGYIDYNFNLNIAEGFMMMIMMFL